MRNGFTLVELALVLCCMGLMAALAQPRLAGILDWIAADQAAREVTTALAVTRHGAAMQATKSRLTITRDTLRIERWREHGWTLSSWQPGPASLGVAIQVSNNTVVFGPTGMGWGVSNTRVVLRRGSQVETITVSRLGRVKRW